MLKTNERSNNMTDMTKYKNISLKHIDYNLIDKIRRVLVPNMVLSRSQTVSILINDKAKKLNGKLKKK
jgi:hypothetical protein|tara:strand:+ start:234 stop:437 length:204 start_codon:yes stop_codon:yes gene_type:complete